MGLHGCLSLSRATSVPHPKLQWSLPSSRAQTLPNGHSIRVHPRVLRIASCKALIRLNVVQRLVFVRPSERAQRARKKFIKMFVQSDPDIPAAFAAALRYSLFVRNICYSAELNARSTVTR